MATSSSPLSPLKLSLLSFSLLAITLFFLLFSPHSHPQSQPHRLLLQSSICGGGGGGGGGIVNYSWIHSCLLLGNRLLSLPALTLLLLLHFSFLSSTAARHFSPAVALLSSTLRLSPSMAAVTLLALGNGAPDLFSSSAALRRGQPRTGLAALVSAGAFVSAFVVGSVAIVAAPFPIEPAPFVRDVFFYLLAASMMFYVYLSAEIYLWQAVGFVGLYVLFVGLVFWMDFFGVRRKKYEDEEKEVEMGLMEKEKERNQAKGSSVWEDDDGKEKVASFAFGWRFFAKILQLWEVPVTTVLNLTIPSTSSSPTKCSKFHTAANIFLCPLALIYSFNSFIAMDTPIIFFIPQTLFPLWSVVLFVSLSLALAHFFLEKEEEQEGEAPQKEMAIAKTLLAFIMSVFWISTMAGELLNCLATIGIVMDLPPAILGLTVLAWGNSVGDLVADVALAKAGQPAMALAGCFVGPMFNMLVGLGSALVIETAEVYPGAYELKFNVGIVVAFVFLLLSLMGSLLVVTWYRFRVPRFWGFCLVGLYLIFTALSLVIARFGG